MNRETWKPKNRIEQMYSRALNRLLNSVFDKLKFLTDPSSIMEQVEKICKTKTFKSFADKLALNMVTAVNTENRRTWREASTENTKGRMIYESLQNEMGTVVGRTIEERVKENAQLIRTLPLSISEKVTDYVQKEQLKGRRASDIAKDIQKMFPEKTMASAKLIARTETSKAQSSLQEARSIKNGLKYYVWRSNSDARRRPAHANLEGVLVRWDTPPAPEELLGMKSEGHYSAGCIYNCRCWASVVVFLDAITFPHKIYRNGKISMITRSEFEKIWKD